MSYFLALSTPSRFINLFSLRFLWPRLPLESFGKCRKFTFIVQGKTRCRRNMQIKIPDESPRRRSIFRCPELLCLSLFGTSYRKILFQPYLAHFLRFRIFSFEKLNLDDFLFKEQKRKTNFENSIWIPVSFK